MEIREELGTLAGFPVYVTSGQPICPEIRMGTFEDWRLQQIKDQFRGMPCNCECGWSGSVLDAIAKITFCDDGTIDTTMRCPGCGPKERKD